MAKQKTTTIKATKEKKTTTRKSKKINKKNKQKNPISIINIIIILIFMLIITYVINNFFLTSNKKQNNVTPISKLVIKNDINLSELLDTTYEERTKELEIQYVQEVVIQDNKEKKIDLNTTKIENELIKQKKIIEVIKKEIINQKKIIKDDEIKIIEQNKKVITPVQDVQIIKHKYNTNSKPLLAILIDDVSTSAQVRKITNLPFDVTMSFLPPTSDHKNSAKIAQNIEFAMIHLPLEAGSRRYEEINTLHIEDSLETIDNRIRKIKSMYPNIKYINNHTGSKFTSNSIAMNKLAKVLKKYGYKFIDSRTSGKTVAKKYANKYNLPFLSRNIFLDNVQDKKYIQNQLKKAINIAIKTGSSIAIGHPHSITIKTLKESTHLFKNVQLVYVNKLDI